MKKLKGVTSRNAIVANIQRAAQVRAERAKLRDEAYELRQNQEKVNAEFITEQLDKFLQDIRSSNNMNYIVFNESSTFTRFVNRNGLRINDAHSEAMSAYNKAKRKLAETFVEGLLSNENGEREKVINWSGIKNINDMEKYFN